MPRGLVRIRTDSGFHFLTFSRYHRQPYLVSAERRDLFLQELERVRVECRFVVVGYVVMPEHVHLLLGEPVGTTVPEVMQLLKQRVSHAARQPSRTTPFWQTRYYDFAVVSEKKRIEKLRYIHRNPVRRGLVEKPEDWLWSSYRHYLFGEPGPVAVAEPMAIDLPRYRS
jgi:putative transposase